MKHNFNRITFLKLFATLIIICLYNSPLLSQDDKGLIIHGEGFYFMIEEPVKWNVNIEDANERQMNAYFTMDGFDFNNSPGLIYIRVMDKSGLSIEEHLKADMDNFKKKNIPIKFETFTVNNLKYDYVSKKYLISNSSCDYLCYIDPGNEYSSYLIFVLTSETKYCDDFIHVFSNLLRTFFWGGDKVITH